MPWVVPLHLLTEHGFDFEDVLFEELVFLLEQLHVRFDVAVSCQPEHQHGDEGEDELTPTWELFKQVVHWMPPGME